MIAIHTSNNMYMIPDILDLSCYNITIETDVGSLFVDTIPEGVKIYIDDVEQMSTTPTTINNIPIGEHSYKLTYSGYIDAEGKVYIESGRTYNLFVMLEKSSANNMIPLLGLLAIGAVILSRRGEDDRYRYPKLKR